jgi:hypothetical protein
MAQATIELPPPENTHVVQSTTRVPELDGLRGVAILLVIISHYIAGASHPPLGFVVDHLLPSPRAPYRARLLHLDLVLRPDCDRFCFLAVKIGDNVSPWLYLGGARPSCGPIVPAVLAEHLLRATSV